MKKKIVVLLSILLVAVIGLAGCGDTRQLSFIVPETAQAAALDAAKLNPESVENIKVDLYQKNGRDYYEVVFKSGGETFEYDVDAVSGKVLEARTPAGGAADSSGQSAEISADKAREIALQDAGVAAAEVKFVKAELERDDGRVYYEVEFYSGSKEYDYEIDVKSGAILSRDFDAENYAPAAGKLDPDLYQSQQPNKNTISADKAKEIALKQVPGAVLADIREFEIDYDDGRLEYEGKIIFNKMEYEFEIDGYSGAIRSWDVESIYD